MEKQILDLIAQFEEVEPNGFNFTVQNKQNTIALLRALRGFHSEEGTTYEQDQMLKHFGLQT